MRTVVYMIINIFCLNSMKFIVNLSYLTRFSQKTQSETSGSLTAEKERRLCTATCIQTLSFRSLIPACVALSAQLDATLLHLTDPYKTYAIWHC